MDFAYDILDRSECGESCWAIVQSEAQSCYNLNEKTGQNYSAEAVEDIDVRRDAFGYDIIRNTLKFQAVFEPIIERYFQSWKQVSGSGESLKVKA